MTERTLIITKEGWKALRLFTGKRNCERYGKKYKQPTDELLEREFARMMFRNLGASNDYPIADDEYRYSESGWGYSIEYIKKFLDERGFTYREDGYIAEFINV